MADWQIGDRPKVTATFTDIYSRLVDPDTLTVKILSPSGVLTTLVYGVSLLVVRDSLGVYHVYISLTESGNWFYRFEATGARTVASEGTLIVLESSFY